jgi:hypothetical protein
MVGELPEIKGLLSVRMGQIKELGNTVIREVKLVLQGRDNMLHLSFSTLMINMGGLQEQDAGGDMPFLLLILGALFALSTLALNNISNNGKHPQHLPVDSL